MADNNNDSQFKDMMETILDIKVAQAKQEANLDRQNDILEKLTKSVEYHILRSDRLEELVQAYKKDSDQKLVDELQPIKAHISFLKGVGWTLVAIGSLIAGLHEMGIIQKLF